MLNDSSQLINEFEEYRRNWSTNKFRMFLTNVLIVMKTWSQSQQRMDLSFNDEDWDRDENLTKISTNADRMKSTGYQLFLAIVDYMKKPTTVELPDRMSHDMEFDLWKRIVTNPWTINEKVKEFLFDSCQRLNLVLSSSC